jgi:hypothetical protein
LCWIGVGVHPHYLVLLCARLPQALAIAAARAAARPRLRLATPAAELHDARGRLDALDGGEAAADARAVFSWSCEQLSPAAAEWPPTWHYSLNESVNFQPCPSSVRVGGAARRL